MRLRGFPHGTVPGLKLDGKRIQGTTKISRALDEAVPEPRLFPADPAERAAVEEAERWGEAVYQPVPRRIFRWSVSNDGSVRRRMARGIPAPVLLPVAKVYERFENGGPAAVQRDLAALPEHLDHVDELIAAGTIDGKELNAADFQIGPTTRVLLNFAELRPWLEGRPAERHAMRILPDFGGPLPTKIPADWLPT
jgi:glutathione S-transferase